MKSLLVSRKILSSVSREIGVGEYLLLSGEESEMGGRDRESILADSFEGIIGAIYLDQGYRAASKFIRKFLLARINDFLKDEEHTNYKSLLQEHVQSKRLSHPVYRVHAEEGPEHEKEFLVEVVVRNEVWGTGRGKSKKDAEQAAARAALESRLRKARAGTGSRGGTASRTKSGRVQGRPEARTSRGRPRSSAPPQRKGGAAPAKEPARAAEPPAKPAAKNGLHGVHASRDLLRASRREEERQQEQEEKAARERRDTRRRRRRGEPAAAPPEEPEPAEAAPKSGAAPKPPEASAPAREDGDGLKKKGAEKTEADSESENGEAKARRSSDRKRFSRRRRRPAQRRGRR
jgi:hypothetical protein